MFKFDSNIYDLLTETTLINNRYEKSLYRKLISKKGLPKESADDILRFFIGKGMSLKMIPDDKQIYYKKGAYYLFSEDEIRNSPLDFELVDGQYVSHYLSVNKKQNGPKHLKHGDSGWLTQNHHALNVLSYTVGVLVIVMSIFLIADLFQLFKHSNAKVAEIAHTTVIDKSTIDYVDDLFVNKERTKLKSGISVNELSRLEEQISKEKLSNSVKESEQNVLRDIKRYLRLKTDISEVSTENPEALFLLLQDSSKIENPYLRSETQEELSSLVIETDLKTLLENQLYDYTLTNSELNSLKKTIDSLSDGRFKEFKKDALAILEERLNITPQSIPSPTTVQPPYQPQEQYSYQSYPVEQQNQQYQQETSIGTSQVVNIYPSQAVESYVNP